MYSKTIILISVFLLALLPISNSSVVDVVQATTPEVYIHEDFETGFDAGYWTYSDKFERSSSWVQEGDYSFKATGPDGKLYDGAQCNIAFSDGKITTYVYPQYSSYHRVALWLRTSEINLNNDPVYDYGYCLRLTNGVLRILSVYNGDFTSLVYRDDLPNIANTVWQMEFEISDNVLTGRVNESSDPETFYNLTKTLQKEMRGEPLLDFGRAGISARTTMDTDYPVYFDNLSISYEKSIYEENFYAYTNNIFSNWNYAKNLTMNTSLPHGILEDSWSEDSLPTGESENWNEDYFTKNGDSGRDGSSCLQMNPVEDGQPITNGAPYDGLQHIDRFTDGSIESWVYPTENYINCPALWLRTCSNYKSDVCAPSTYDQGYMLRIYKYWADIYYYKEGMFVPLLTQVEIKDQYTNINDKWWHMKFEIVGNVLRAEISDGIAISLQLIYNLTPEHILSAGNAGISARSDKGWKTYFDDVKVTHSLNPITKYSLAMAINRYEEKANGNPWVGPPIGGENFTTARYIFLKDRMNFDYLWNYGDGEYKYEEDNNYTHIWTDIAKENIVREKIQQIIAIADENDIVLLQFSTHGTNNEDHKGMLMWDIGQYYEPFELRLDIIPAVAEKLFIWIHSCHSGVYTNNFNYFPLPNNVKKSVFLVVSCKANEVTEPSWGEYFYGPPYLYFYPGGSSDFGADYNWFTTYYRSDYSFEKIYYIQKSYAYFYAWLTESSANTFVHKPDKRQEPQCYDGNPYALFSIPR